MNPLTQLRWYIREFHATRDRSRRSEATIGHLENAIDVLLGVPTDFEALAFNGQKGRQAIFADLIAAISASEIIETGTYTGVTTGYMALRSGLPVVSCEVNPRFHAVAKLRLRDFTNVNLANLDSREFLGRLACEDSYTEPATFFYLDAHWYGDFPLLEEIGLIAENWKEFVVMIDDFQVAGDSGYAYDDYGKGEALTLDYIRPAVAKYNLDLFFPVRVSSQETGHKRGCAVLAGVGLARCLKGVKSLRRWKEMK